MTYPTPAQVQPHVGPPASANPVHDYLMSAQRPGVSAEGAYVVLPRPVLEALPLPVQQAITHALAQVHQVTAGAPWPIYRVVPSRWARLAELDERGLAEVGVIPELGAGGELVHRNMTTGTTLSDSDLEQQVLVSQPDPLLHRQQPRSDRAPR
jgi:hypothetical protein